MPTKGHTWGNPSTAAGSACSQPVHSGAPLPQPVSPRPSTLSKLTCSPLGWFALLPQLRNATLQVKMAKDMLIQAGINANDPTVMQKRLPVRGQGHMGDGREDDQTPGTHV